MKILFIGNSYTYYNDMPAIFQKLTEENGISANVFSVTSGGHYLRQNLEPGDTCGMQLTELLKQHRFDFCFLQEQSTYPIRNPGSFCRDAVKLADAIAPSVDCFILYATWGRQLGAKFLAEAGLTTESMTCSLEKEYRSAAEALEAETGKPTRISPVGRAFWQLTKTNAVDLYNPDLSHPAYEGSCLAALVHFKTVYGKLPDSTDCLNLSKEVLALLYRAAAAC